MAWRSQTRSGMNQEQSSRRLMFYALRLTSSLAQLQELLAQSGQCTDGELSRAVGSSHMAETVSELAVRLVVLVNGADLPALSRTSEAHPE
jgi:hypothetical protein